MNAGGRLCVAVLWHQHQPFYRTSLEGAPEGAYLLPWVRLHSVRDYYPMAALLDEFPDVRVTVNLVPSLVFQIEDYVRRPGARFWWKAALFTAAAAIFVLGVMALWTFSFDEMGAAVRALNE